jgi:hypothetical protein
VFRAYDASRERLVAVKLFKLDLPPERAHQLVAEFERLIAADLTHPAIAAPLVTGISDVSAFLAQEYVAADSLDLVVREYGPSPLGSALRVAAQLAGALDFAAAAQVTHGALHPRDVLLSSDDTRLTGLGVTRALERIGVVAPVRRPYTAPERIGGAGWDRRADVFSLAALMHELIWGRRVSGHGAQAAEGLTEIAGGDLRALKAVFARALADKPDARYGSALEFADALRIACPNVVPELESASAPPGGAAAPEHEQRLPLNELPVADLEIAPPAPPVLADTAADLRDSTQSRGRRADTSDSFELPDDLDLVPPVVVEPEIRYEPAAEVSKVIALPQISTPGPVREITFNDSDGLSALERTRSAIWPLVLALVVGIAIGFAGGFFAGSREQPLAIAAAPSPAPVGKEFTEGAVTTSEKPAVRGQKSEEVPKSEVPKPATPTPKSDISTPNAQTDLGRLLVRSSPAGARVSVDGKDYGATPATVRDLAHGAHRVRVVHDGYGTEERRIVITPSRLAQSMTVELSPARAAVPTRTAPTSGTTTARFAGPLAVDSRPAGAQVFIDGKLAGTTPMTVPSVAAGSHVIRLDHDGYRRWSSSVRIVAGEQNRVTASLER